MSSEVMTLLILMRHGQSIWNAQNRFTGWTDVELSELGVKEAIAAGDKISFGATRTSFSAVFSCGASSGFCGEISSTYFG
mgnify:CR=1 FL=1